MVYKPLQTNEKLKKFHKNNTNRSMVHAVHYPQYLLDII